MEMLGVFQSEGKLGLTAYGCYPRYLNPVQAVSQDHYWLLMLANQVVTLMVMVDLSLEVM